MENWPSTPYMYALSTSAPSARNHISVACKTVLRLCSRRITMILRLKIFNARNAWWNKWATDRKFARSTATIILTGSAWGAAQWLYSSAPAVQWLSALLATMMPWQDVTTSHQHAQVVTAALSESLNTPSLALQLMLASHWVAACADQKRLLLFKRITKQAPVSLLKIVKIW